MKNVISALLALASCFALASTAFSRDVSDDAKFFSPEAVRKANAAIEEFKQKYRKDIVIETYPGIPENKKAGYQPDKKNEFYTAWLRERAQALKVDGIYVLITRDPAHLQVGVGSQTAKMGFSREDRDKVRNILVEQFKNKQYDLGLLGSISAISNRFGELNRARPTAAPVRGVGTPPVATTPSKTGGLSWVTWLIIAIVGILIVRFISRAFQRMAYGGPQRPNGPGGYGGGPGYGPPSAGGGGGPGYGPPPAAGGGGGFFSSILGGLAGGAAGNWLANRWTGGSPGERGAPPGSQGDEGGGFEGSSGGDFGGPSDIGGGGGDFGGGDSGGGDFGGGGGGSDSGGGDF